MGTCRVPFGKSERNRSCADHGNRNLGQSQFKNRRSRPVVDGLSLKRICALHSWLCVCVYCADASYTGELRLMLRRAPLQTSNEELPVTVEDIRAWLLFGVLEEVTQHHNF